MNRCEPPSGGSKEKVSWCSCKRVSYRIKPHANVCLCVCICVSSSWLGDHWLDAFWLKPRKKKKKKRSASCILRRARNSHGVASFPHHRPASASTRPGLHRVRSRIPLKERSSGGISEADFGVSPDPMRGFLPTPLDSLSSGKPPRRSIPGLSTQHGHEKCALVLLQIDSRLSRHENAMHTASRSRSSHAWHSGWSHRCLQLHLPSPSPSPSPLDDTGTTPQFGFCSKARAVLMA